MKLVTLTTVPDILPFFQAGRVQWRNNWMGRVDKDQGAPKCRGPRVSGKKIKIIFPK